MEKCARANLFYLYIWHSTYNNNDDLQNGLFIRDCVFTCEGAFCTYNILLYIHINIVYKIGCYYYEAVGLLKCDNTFFIHLFMYRFESLVVK